VNFRSASFTNYFQNVKQCSLTFTRSWEEKDSLDFDINKNSNLVYFMNNLRNLKMNNLCSHSLEPHNFMFKQLMNLKELSLDTNNLISNDSKLQLGGDLQNIKLALNYRTHDQFKLVELLDDIVSKKTKMQEVRIELRFSDKLYSH